ncbi:hypothetical protein HHK36_027943 [Tetracentron sinense]|uniref:Cytochrome P450 n=1 Tax=Tetracentron sinense TaxID=13715 RepID=A0A835D403_TETSI|nr:hypothetical protein HHK36_027943 [Tetracentron sinense]
MALNPAFEIKGIIRHAWSWWWKGSNQKLDYARVVFTLLIALAVISLYKWLIKNSKKERVQLPPGPQGLPLVGNLPFLDPELHRCFAELAGTYGPIMKLRLGCKLCIVITSPSLAREVLKDQDTSFANRDVPAVGFLSSYGGLDIVWSPYGAQWRMQRKICVKEMLNKGRLDALYGLRRREVRAMVSQVYSYKSNPVDIGDQMLLTMFNVITSMLWGGILKGEERNHVTAEFRLVMEKVLGLLGEPNVSDLFPAIAWFDIQGKGRRMKKLMLCFDRLFDSVINRRLRMQDLEGEERNNDKESKDFLQVLLHIKDQGDTEAPFTITHIKALLMIIPIMHTHDLYGHVDGTIVCPSKYPHTSNGKELSGEFAATVNPEYTKWVK